VAVMAIAARVLHVDQSQDRTGAGNECRDPDSVDGAGDRSSAAEMTDADYRAGEWPAYGM
jgi:hypothetical protein